MIILVRSEVLCIQRRQILRVYQGDHDPESLESPPSELRFVERTPGSVGATARWAGV